MSDYHGISEIERVSQECKKLNIENRTAYAGCNGTIASGSLAMVVLINLYKAHQPVVMRCPLVCFLMGLSLVNKTKKRSFHYDKSRKRKQIAGNQGIS